MAMVTPPRPLQAPMAAARSSLAKLAPRMARLPGVKSAPPTPCRRRLSVNVSVEPARPQATDAAVNQATPHMNTQRRPKRSPSAPPSKRNAESVSV